MIVTKFGGSSLADAEHVRKVYEIIKSNPERKVVVVSAPGKRVKTDQKVTDLLIKTATDIINSTKSLNTNTASTSSASVGADNASATCASADIASAAGANAANATPAAPAEPESLRTLLGRFNMLVEDLELDHSVYEAIKDDIYSRISQYGNRYKNEDRIINENTASGNNNNGNDINNTNNTNSNINGNNINGNNINIKVNSSMPENEFLDLMKAAGENNCAKIITAYFNKRGLPSVFIDPKDAGFNLSESFGNARILPQSYQNIANALRGLSEIIIFPGFYGYTLAGKVITFSRGGSDVTGSALAAALDATLYENFTDVDHVYAVNPDHISNPEPLREITYREMRELSYGDFQVYHEDALVPVFQKGVPVHIKNTNNPSEPGTVILRERTRPIPGRPVTGISSAEGFLCVHISKLLMNMEIGYGQKVLRIIEDEGLPFEHMPSGIDNISVILRESTAAPDKIDRIIARLIGEVEADEVTVRRGLAIVMIVGEGMLHTVGTAARATGALARASVNIEIINQGSSEVSLMFGVDANDADKAVKSLYNEFFGQ